MASDSSMEWWRGKWEDGKAFWHSEQANSNLLNNMHHLHNMHLAASKKPEDAGLIFLPLCGKVLDMKNLYEQGYKVLGIDCAEQPVREFFQENNIQYKMSRDDRIGDVYSTPDGRLRVVCGDMFKLTLEIVGEPVMMIWDRGGFGAVDKEMRRSYARVVCSLVGPGARIVMDTMEYDDWYYSGPPRNVPTHVVDDLFGEHFEIKLVQMDPPNTLIEKVGGGRPEAAHQNIHLMVAKKN